MRLRDSVADHLPACREQQLRATRRHLQPTNAHPVAPLTYACIHARTFIRQQNAIRCSAAEIQPSIPLALDEPAQPHELPEHHALIMDAVRDPGSLSHITLRGRIGPKQPWRQISIRPVMLKGNLHLQLSQFTQKQNIVKNLLPGDATQALDELLQLSWSFAAVACAGQTVNMQITKRGKAIIQGRAASAAAAGQASAIGPINLSHDRHKDLPIPPNRPDPFLHQIGLQTEDGRVRAGMAAKFTQVNEFLKLLQHSGILDEAASSSSSSSSSSQSSPDDSTSSSNSTSSSEQKSPADSSSTSSSTSSHQSSLDDNTTTTSATATLPPAAAPPAAASTSPSPPLHILDAGCGSSLLTFTLYHYLSTLLHIPATITGIDSNAHLISRNVDLARRLSISHAATFQCAPIRAFRASPNDAPPDVILALHACDTATDEALALGVRNRSRLIMSVPCCHKHLHQQLGSREPMQPLLRHGILRQRFGDLMTDSFRALILRILGYNTDVVEFVSVEHTQRNVLIRAVQGGGRMPRGGFVEEYVQMKAFWGVRPYLEELLEVELREVDPRLVGGLVAAGPAEGVAEG